MSRWNEWQIFPLHSSNTSIKCPFFIEIKDSWQDGLKSDDFNLQVVADISCDIDGPIASTIRSSTVENPIYGYNPETESEDDFKKKGVIAVMAVDNLPCELPKDSSEYFGNEFINKILPYLIGEDPDRVIERATICKDGDLTPDFEYLKNYLNGD